MSRRERLMKIISAAGDQYGNGEHGLIALMEEANKQCLPDVTDKELADFCKRHGILKGGREMNDLISRKELREWWLANGLNERIYDTNDMLDSIDNAPDAESASYEQVSKVLCGKDSATAEEIIAAYEQVKRELDAAVTDLRYRCDICAHESHEPECLSCSCKHNNWRWRGVCAENS